jgi:ParB-like chromosome segregation protein Spo0J
MRPVDTLKACKSNARTHSRKQIRQIADSIQRFAFINPILVDENGELIAGHGRLEAAKLLGLAEVPTLRVGHLCAVAKRGYALADNRLAELAGWDDEILAIELQELRGLDFDLAAIGFELADVDIVVNEAEKTDSQRAAPKPDRGAGTSGRTVSRAGDLWRLGEHELRCGETGPDGSYAAVDAAIRRWQRVTGQPAMLAASGKSFAAVAKERAGTAAKARAPRQAAGKREAA